MTERTRRITISSVVATEDNGYTGTFNIGIHELDETLSFTYEAPRVTPFIADAIDAGIRNRISTIVAPLKASEQVTLPQAILTALQKQLALFNAGVFFTVHKEKQVREKKGISTFNKYVIAKVIEDMFPEVTTGTPVEKGHYISAMENIDLLKEVQSQFASLDVKERKEVVKSKTIKAVDFYKD